MPNVNGLQVEAGLPEKQGLKLRPNKSDTAKKSKVEAGLPEKQGLKPGVFLLLSFLTRVEAGLPEKQGLKHLSKTSDILAELC